MTFDPMRNPSDDLAVRQGCHFDEGKGLRACRFIETFCRQSKGKWAGQSLELMDHQRDLLMRLFGWRRADGRRRFRTVYVEQPKKNGKSTMVSSLTLYLEVDSEEGAPEIYLNAVDREQADIVFEECCRMVEASPQLKRRLKVSRYHGTIADPARYGKIRKNSADAPSKDGVNASGVIFDEIHRFKDRQIWDIMTYSGISREEPLRIVITTAGEEMEGIWYEQREFSEKVNSGEVENTTHLGVIHRARTEADPGGPDDVDDPATWARANPSMGVTMSIEEFRAAYEEAKSKGGAEWANFLRLRLGIVARAQGKFLSIEAWDACDARPDPDPDGPCWMGLDLSSTDDLTALVTLSGEPSGVLDLECRFWLPGGIIVELEHRHGQPYREWARNGLITLTPGLAIDEEFIEAEIGELARDRDVMLLLVDPWHARRIGTSLKGKYGLPVEFLRQGYGHLSEATKRLRTMVTERRLRHGGHPIMRWHAGNAITTMNAAGDIMLDKSKRRKKIDGMAAAVNAMAGIIASPDIAPSVYETGGIFTI